MAATKRKRKSTRTKPEKRPKYANSSDQEAPNGTQEQGAEKDEFWFAERILEEKVERGRKQFKVQWQGLDPKTGTPWEPTWEPKENCTELLLASWEIEKTVSHSTTREGSRGKGKGRSRKSDRERPAQRRLQLGREALARGSSPSASTLHSVTFDSLPSTPASAILEAPLASSAATTPTGADTGAAGIPRESPRIAISRRGSFNAEEYDRYSQLATSQTQSRFSSSQLRTQATDLDSSQLFAATRAPSPQYSSGIVLDSQDSAGEATFLPATQHTEDSNQQSTATTDESQEVEGEEEEEDSGLLEIIQQGVSVELSPARSIAETIPDTNTAGISQSLIEISESNTQTQDVIEISDSAETIGESQSEGTQGDSQEGTVQVAEEAVSQRKNSRVEDEPQISLPNDLVDECHSVLQEAEVSEVSPQDQQQDAQRPREDERQQQELSVGRSESASGSTVHPPVHTLEEQSLACDDTTESVIQVPHTQPQETNRVLDQPVLTSAEASTSVALPPRQESAPRPASGESSTAPTLSHVQPHQPGATPLELISRLEENLKSLIEKPATQEPVRSPSSGGVAQAQLLQGDPHNTAWQATQPSQTVPDTILRRDFACQSQLPNPTAQSTASREQNAQIVPLEVELSTQEDITESIETTVEDEHGKERGSPQSRHDSSQDSPVRPGSLHHSSSPIRNPPSFSLATVASKLPSRPTTPLSTSFYTNMSGESTGDQVKRALQEALEKRRAENPFIPTPRPWRRPTPSSTSPSFASVSTRRLFGANASPIANDGTRSPSAIPDHAPIPPAPTSLSAVIAAPNNDTLETVSKVAEKQTVVEAAPSTADIEVLAAPEPELPLEDAESIDEDEQLSDADDEDSGSLLHDDLKLEPEEYIIPLFIEGRQLDMYTAHIQQQKELLQRFLKDPIGFTPLSKVEEILSYLKAVETHMDLVFAEAGPSSVSETVSQVEFTAQFGMENSAKFRFLHTLFHRLREYEKHVVLVIEDDNDALFHILEIFCKAEHVNYNMPTQGRQADSLFTDGAMPVTIIPSNASPIIRAPDIIICLDGMQEAARIRQKNWARSPVRRLVPVFHLVIPRTVGHIERYVSPSLSHLDKLHTTVAGLAQMSMSAEIGQPVDEATERAPVIAEMVVDWLVAGGTEDLWPLPSIGSIKDVIEYQTQVSSQGSSTPPAPENNKRPLLDEDHFDSAKRMRYTPQPHNTSSVNHDQEITRISDSMPGTAGNLSGGVIETNLRRQLARTEEALQEERAARKAEQEKMQMWERQLTEHEDLRREHRTLISHDKATEAKLETASKSLEITRERLSTRTAESNEKSRQLDEQRATDALSPDEKTAEITRLRQELATVQLERSRAVNDSTSAESLLEYTKEARRAAEDSLSAAQATIQQLTAENEKLKHQASGQATKLKALHLDRQTSNLKKQLQSSRNEIAILKRTLAQKEEELTRAKNGRQGVGTRMQSVTPQPKTRSRAGSPMGGRVSNLRKE
ncbi:hypothetical protein J1614_000757 [Plenodomus biglobosus]|nr:hypothetical protein J1614_000757 [Plenodomus biglobosus]